MALFLLPALLAFGCRDLHQPTSTSRALSAPSSGHDYLSEFKPVTVGHPLTQPPWIAHVTGVDLDHDGRTDVLVSDAKENKVLWLRQVAAGQFTEMILAADIPAPVHVEAVDLDHDGDLDLLVACMGYVFPNNDKIGTVVLLENDGLQNFTRHDVLAQTARVTDIRAADFDEDGNLDLAVAQFGYDQGEVRWMRRTGPWSFTSEVLLDLSGAINIGVADFNGDGHLDIVALISQQWEEIYLFQNDGHGRFSRQVLWGSTNEDFGSSGLSVADVNGDGRPDLLYTNGDGFGPAVTPGPRPWHGVQWLENTGGGRFQFHRVADLPGAYSPIGVDLDQDGALDIVVTTAYLEWNNGRPLPSLVWYHNDGKNRFSARVLAHTPKDLMSVTAGDFDGSGRPSLMTGGFPVNPPFGNISRLTLWRR